MDQHNRVFGHVGCGEVNNNVNTSWHQDWIRQVCGIIVIHLDNLIVFNAYYQASQIILE